MSNKNEAITGVIIAVIAMVILLPGLVSAGSLEPSGPPASTMKTLDQVPPTWSQKLQCDTTACPRFQLVLDGFGVLDKETGLVWAKSPNPTPQPWSASSACRYKSAGNRKGWRLPTVEELSSLVDPTVAPPALALPNGHPFSIGDTVVGFWSSTTFDGNTANAWGVEFLSGAAFILDKTNSEGIWCVRGGQGYDGH